MPKGIRRSAKAFFDKTRVMQKSIGTESVKSICQISKTGKNGDLARRLIRLTANRDKRGLYNFSLIIDAFGQTTDGFEVLTQSSKV